MYALFIVELSTRDGGRHLNTEYINWMQNVTRRNRNNAIGGALGAGVYLLNLDNGMHDLTTLVAAAEDHGCSSRVLYFDQEPAFVITTEGLTIGNDGN